MCKYRKGVHMESLVAQKIREARLKRGVTQTELSKRTDIHRNTIINFETGRRDPRVKDLRKIAKALNVSVKELISDTED
jgi:transcriptional regulator with XRE-family HTH domain